MGAGTRRCRVRNRGRSPVGARRRHRCEGQGRERWPRPHLGKGGRTAEGAGPDRTEGGARGGAVQGAVPGAVPGGTRGAAGAQVCTAGGAGSGVHGGRGSGRGIEKKKYNRKETQRKRDIGPRPAATSLTQRRGANGSAVPSPRLKSPKAPPRAAALGSFTPVQAPPLAPVPAPPPGPRPPPAHKTRQIGACPVFCGGCSSREAAGASVGALCGDPDRGLLLVLRGIQGAQVGPGPVFGPMIQVLVLLVFPVGPGPSHFFLGGQGMGTRAGGSRRDCGWDWGHHHCGREKLLRDRRCRSGCGQHGAGSHRGPRHAPAAVAGSRCCAAAMAARRMTLPRSSLWIAPGSGKDTETARTGPGTPSASPLAQRHHPPGPSHEESRLIKSNAEK
ncbi:uncharacterized protein LOC143693780 [Agelaius phoeniceus]|uniref:uncharacterized protein LOC143693780 n=1 Tax=Agelaius phoeniceus TaxID=39638 RepID=UPI004054D414